LKGPFAAEKNKAMNNIEAIDPFAMPTFQNAEGLGLSDAPVLTPLAQKMAVDLVINPDSKVWLLHDQRFQDIVMWAEYDVDSASLILVMRDGKMQDLGMKIHAPMRKYLRAARQLYTMRVDNGKIADTYILPLLVRETGYYKA